MILRVVILSVLISLSRSSDGDFMNAVRSLLYKEPGQNSSSNPHLSDEAPGLFVQEESNYPNPPSFASYPQFTVGISGGGSGAPCNLPQQIGTGPYRIPRWYFNPARMRCELFYWSGCCGNGNNFNTFQSCQQVCEGSTGPEQKFLNVQASNQMPSEWLLTRSLPQTQISVSVATKDCCQKPFSTGQGGLQLPRWYYESQSGSCQIYLYRGSGGFGNSFESFEECQRVCQNQKNMGPAPHIILPEPSNVIIGVTTPRPPRQPPLVQVPQVPQLPLVPIVVTTPPRQEIIELALPPQFPPVVMTPRPQPPPLPPVPLLPPLPPPPSVDPCGQEKDQGVGALQLPRFFFNKDTKLCEEFLYFGSAGNRNNFVNLEECQRQCPESPNPCAYGTSSSLIQCGPGTVLSQTCSGQQFCHVGANSQTTVCCNKPASNTDRCNQPLNVGVGNSNLPRWYFNPLTQQCQSCMYKGLQGNENNFISKQDCENSCVVNPCQRGVAYKSQGVTVQCSVNNQAVCPAGYYCHLGADPSTSVCCQALVSNPCNEILNKGEGSSALTRYYYDAEKRQCLPFNYLGTKGNTNNFLTKESCEQKCPVWVNPCKKGNPMLGMDGKPIQCSKIQPCLQGFYCHVGYDDETTVCCPSTSEPCQAEMTQGTGPHFMSRWYYDSNLRQCKQFTYKGLFGNENNFLLRDHCEQTCPTWENVCAMGEPILGMDNKPMNCVPGQDNSCPTDYWCHAGIGSGNACCPGKQDPCVLAVIEGSGNSVQQRWFFDLTDKQCKQFLYRGSKGNANNFLTREQCEKTCPVFVDPCPNSYAFAAVSNLPVQYVKCSSQSPSCPSSFWCHFGANSESTVCCPNAVSDPCSLPSKVQGSGELKLTRWSFDSATKKCEPFEYFGVKGNQNNFVSRESCESACPAFENPCRTGDPYMVSGRPQICKRETPCPNNYYCHIGADDNKYCCPAVGGDPCGQPMSCGIGNAQLGRWYWDQNRQQCLSFVYKGQKGTQNNFLSKQDCDRTCYELENPCALGEPQMISPTEIRYCSISNPNTCAVSYWCHVGASEQTTLCCPGKVSPQEVCQQPLQVGNGFSNLPRWYYNPTTRCCLPFTYGGTLGNENNFLTKDACEDQCVAINVCPFGEPQRGPDDRVLTCVFNGTQCAPGHFCHLGLTPEENQCCPGEPTNPGACQGLPSQPGVAGPPGANPTERWYYEVGTMSCKSFLFNGRKGNQNNFLTEADCAATCEVFVNPCNQPIPMPPQTCSAQNPNSCTGNCWCHIGAGPSTTVCCPSEGNPCDLPLNRGTGGESLPRWFYNQQTGTCEPFNYCGLKGNQNNFLSREMCEGMCAPNPCAEGRPFIGVDGRTQTCSASATLNTCPSTYWCHIGADQTTTVCCPGASQNSCNLPMSTGEGNQQLERFYFDSATKTCKPFIYLGLKGNQNNFLTLRSCQLACQPLDNPCIGQPATTPSGQVLFCSATNKDTCPVNFWCHLGATPETTVCCPGATNACSVPLAPGTGNSGLARWYYNPDDRECVPFQYNGRRGNQNNFLSQAECERTCPVFKNPCIGEIEMDKSKNPRECDPLGEVGCSEGYFCMVGNPEKLHSSYCCKRISKDPCETYLAEGQGKLQLSRWYYNPFKGKCQMFSFRGTKGNENNFLTKKICEQSCQPLSNVCFGGQEPLKNGNTVVGCKWNSDCPETHFCHIGAEKRANICCKRQGKVCDQQLMIGIGDAKLERFYYNEVEDRCSKFNYSGLGGNENNFLTKAQCEITCPGFKGICPHGKPLLKSDKIVSCGIDTACPKGHVCHVTKKETKSVCCPDPASFCLLPSEPGPCRNFEKRYFYKKSTGICESFKFGGCFGNLNNFESLESCTEICCDKGYF